MTANNLLTSIKGVYAGAIASGIKENAKDLAFIYVPEACACAGTYTQNSFAAACVDYSRQCTNNGVIKAIIINSGNANAATGEQGHADCLEMAQLAANCLSLSTKEVAIASTGIIGKKLPMDVLRQGIPRLLKEPQLRQGTAAAEAIMTTDLVSKEVLAQAQINGELVSIAGIAKGSGMIAPNMATMLGFLVTDANLQQEQLATIFRRVIARSFNMISVDTDTSTNDMVLCIANAACPTPLESEDCLSAFEDLLLNACIELAKKIARDGEGASKLIEVEVTGANCEKHASALALSVANSPLVKTAIHGEDPNWGRVIMALGKTPDVALNPNDVSVSFQSTEVFSNGQPVDFDSARLREALADKEITISARIGNGPCQAKAWGCDLTKGYIDINVDYN